MLRAARATPLLLTVLSIGLSCLPQAKAATPTPVIKSPKVTAIRCWPSVTCGSNLRVPVGSWILIQLDSSKPGPKVRFTGGLRVPARRIRANRLLVQVPIGAKTGSIRVSAIGSRWSAPFGRLTPIAAPTLKPPTPTGSAFDGNAMWIWQLANTEKGNLTQIIARARAHDVTTVFLKAGDGTHSWPQFNTPLIRTLHAAGIQVCAWPYVYGKSPSAEAAVAINAIKLGADCLAIDAETEYEGRYTQALTYISKVRKGAGRWFPISLAGYPWADYHQTFPYSVFLGPGGAQYSQPQVYWRDIGSGVDNVMTHTYRTNLLYGRTIFPLGQLWQKPTSREILRFRSLAAVWGSPGVSWWDWQEASLTLWPFVGSQMSWPPATTAAPAWYTLRRGARGDFTIWAQLHLKQAGQSVRVDGTYGSTTVTAVTQFQSSRGIPQTGVIDTVTWKALLRVRLPVPAWASGIRSAASAARASGATAPPARHEFRTRRLH